MGSFIEISNHLFLKYKMYKGQFCTVKRITKDWQKGVEEQKFGKRVFDSTGMKYKILLL